jgi:DNA mismatch repair protein MutS2
MLYPDNFEQKVGFDQVRNLLKKRCFGSLGLEKVEDMQFFSDFDLMVEHLDRSEEFFRILQHQDQFPEIGFQDVRPALKRLRIEGTWLDEAEVFDLRRSLESIHRIVQFFAPDEFGTTPYPRLSALAGNTVVFPDVLKHIDGILSKFGKLLDSASPVLMEIRRELLKTSSGLSKRMAQIMRQAQQDGLVEKDASPSVREGRLVIPISPAYKRKIRGIVHDESATGKTIFIEPEELVEANNRIRELENEERREIIRILTQFADKLRPIIPEMVASYELLGEIDFVQAKAKLAVDIEAIRPRLENIPSIDWVKARHPLLLLSLRKQQKEVVPLTLSLDNRNRILIISGPNAGGKSVCLKTVGLLQYMVQCGLMIPLHDSSRVGFFQRLFIDIGDEQSIENDLSTYSSHLLNMKHFLRNANSSSLLLIDEFGSGTEPKIGGAIAQACLARFNQQEALGVITTHYSNLKHYADEHDGLINGAMLYDRHEMRPLFQLEAGRPGSSFAVEIARKIGLPEDLIADASSLVGSEYIDMDKFLQDIVRDKRYWENKRNAVRIQEKKLAELTARYETDVDELTKKRKEILNEAKDEAQRIIRESNALIENTIRGIKEAQAEKEKTKDLRQQLKDFNEVVVASEDAEHQRLLDEKISRKIEKIRRREDSKGRQVQSASGDSTSLAVRPIVSVKPKLEVKSTVKLKGQNTVGVILEIKGNKAVVAFGSVKSTVSVDQLEAAQPAKENKTDPYTTIGRRTSDEIREKKLQFKQEIDVRGMRGDEALQAVTYFIDDAIMTGVSRVRILHGTGTGALRQLIRQYLGTVHGVNRYADEHIQFGGAGITVVDLE